MQTATFGAGCFWGVEEVFRVTEGVLETAVGYEGGAKENPTYEDVCSKTTGHAEVVELKFDPNIISYEKLLKKFFEIHDPTTVDRQGPDIGSQYRSVIFYHTEEQKGLAEKVKEEVKENFSSPIVTEISKAETFYKAEEYHQQYLAKTGRKVCH